MESDDAADLLLEIEQDRRIPVLNLLPAEKEMKIKLLLGYNPSTAGGLMNPDFITIAGSATIGVALMRLRASTLTPTQLLTLWVVDDGGHLVGAVLASELLLADPRATVASLVETPVPTISPATELPEVARLMADFNLLAIPVIDDTETPIGVVAVGDVLAVRRPEPGGRRAAAAR
jgi:Mg/Co/Ni transporter MgtE